MEIISPLERGRRYGVASAAFLFWLILAELEGLMFLAFTLIFGTPELFSAVHEAIFPASMLIAATASGAVLWRARTWAPRRSRAAIPIADLSESFSASNWRERIGA